MQFIVLGGKKFLTHEKCDQASHRWSKLHLCLFLRFLVLFLYSYLLFLSWSSNGQILLFCLCSFLWSILYLLVLLCPGAQVQNPKKSRCPCSWSTAPRCSSSAGTSYVLIVAAFNRRCCWSAPEVLFIKVATSMPSRIGAPVCCSDWAFTVSQALKSCSKVCVLNFHSSILVRSDTCRMPSGHEKRWLSLRQASKPFPATFWRTRSRADPMHKLGRLVGNAVSNVLISTASSCWSAVAKCASMISTSEVSALTRKSVASGWKMAKQLLKFHSHSCQSDGSPLKVFGNGNRSLPKSPACSAIIFLESLKS